MPERTSMRSNSGAEELLVLLVGAEAHDALDAGAVVPAAVEQHDLARRRQVRHIALEVPLRALAVVGRRKRRDAAHARIQPLRDALDNATLARRIAALEQDDDLVAGVLHPVLQLDQLALQPEQLAEVTLSCGGSLVAGHDAMLAVLQFELQFLVEVVLQVTVNALHQFVFDVAHGGSRRKGGKLDAGYGAAVTTATPKRKSCWLLVPALLLMSAVARPVAHRRCRRTA
jgi:hypothetical protein